MILKNQLKSILREKDMTASQLSRKTGLPRQTISDWLSGSLPRDVRQLKKVADALSTDIDFLCFGNAIERKGASGNQTSDAEGWTVGIFEIHYRKVGNK